MTTILRALAVLVGIATIAPESPHDSPEWTSRGFGPRTEALIPWAFDLFDRAGLVLPDVELVHHDGLDECHGSRGWYSATPAGARIDICVPDGNVSAERLLLHELAHAWDTSNLTPERRAELLDEWGAEQWWDDGTREWGEYGAERAAEIIAWGLIDRPIRLSRLPVRDCEHLREAFIELTGDEPLHGLTEQCEMDS